MDEDAKFSPPYNVPWATFISTAERIAADPPNRIDRSYLGSTAGSIQTYLIAALKGFDLIDDKEARPTGILGWTDEEKRKARVADLLHTYYGPMVELGKTNSTPAELAETFGTVYPQITGESRTKAIRFFLSAMAYAGLPVAAMWSKVKAPRGASGRKAAARKPRSNAPGGTGGGSGGGETLLTAKSGHSHTVRLPVSGGTVTLSVDVNPLSLKGTERDWFYAVVDKLDEYADDGELADDS